MLRKVARELTYANVMATIAVFIALGGGAYAVTIPRNSIGSAQIKKGAVNTSDIKPAAINSKLLEKGAVDANAIGPNAVRASEIARGSLTREDFKAGEIPEGPRGPAGPKGDTGGPPPVEGVTGASLVNGFANFDEFVDGSADVPVGFYKDPFGVVHLQGALERAAAPPDFTTMFVLPEGYRPAGYRSFPVITTGHNDTDEQLGYLQVAEDGRVDYVGGKVGYFSVSGVSFRAGF
jgi:hypothetical protein